jgi:DNA-directed RNA polymerase subunit L
MEAILGVALEKAGTIANAIKMVGGALLSTDEPSGDSVKPKKKRVKIASDVETTGTGTGKAAAAAASSSSSSSDSEANPEGAEGANSEKEKKKRKPRQVKVAVAEGDVVDSAKAKSKHPSVSASAASAAKVSSRINAHKLPTVSGIHVSNGELRFTLENADVSIANGLRRILLSEIPCVVFRTDVHADTTENTVFHVNTTRHHNEILKQRVRCIPICIPDKHTITDFNYKAYRCEVRKKNMSDVTEYVTTGDFKIIEKATGKENVELTKKMFVADPLSGHYIEFARLLPRVVDYTEGEELHISAEFQIGTAEQDGAYNVCSTCTYACTPDKAKQDDEWAKVVPTQELASGSSGSGKEKEADSVNADAEKNWRLSTAQRIFKENSFDFIVETVSTGVYTNGELIRKACDCMKIKCETFIEKLNDEANIVDAKYLVTIPFAFNIILRKEGYTLGKALENLIYSKHYLGDRTLTFCAFKKVHPHDVDSFIQVALQNDTENNAAQVAAIAVAAAKDIISIFEHIKKQFADEP